MNLPAPFTEYTRALLGNEEYEKLSAALEQEPPVSIRLNPSFLTDANSPISLLSSPVSPVPWCPEGHYLGQRLTFTFDSFPCRLLLCAGSLVDVRWTSVEAVCFRRTGGDARSLCRSRWKIDSCL